MFKHFAGKSHSVFEGLKGGPFEHTKTFFFTKIFCSILFSTFIKNALDTNSRILSQKYAQNKKRKTFLTARSSSHSVSVMFFPMLVETPYFGGVFNPKSYLNHELGSNFFFLSGLAYKLVNLLVFEKKIK